MEAEMEEEHDRVHRIASVLMTAFLQFREATWHTHIRNVEKKGKILVIRDDTNGTYRLDGWWAMFLDIIVALKDPANMAALLTTKSCYDLAHMTKLIEQMFEGMNCHIEEVVLRLKLPSPHRSIITYSNNHIDFNDHDFWVLRLTSRTTGQVWAVHLAGAQYYMPGPLTLWSDFQIDKILAVCPLRTLSRYATALAQTKSTAGLEAEVQFAAMAAWHSAVDPAMSKKGLTWRSVLDKNEEDFKRHSAKILDKGNRAVQEFRRSANLNKRRLKAERFEKRHGEWKEEGLGIAEEVLGYRPRMVEMSAQGYMWLVSGYGVPELNQMDTGGIEDV